MTPENLLVLAVRAGIDLGFFAQQEPPKKARPKVDPLVGRRMLKMLGALPKQNRPKGIDPAVFRTAKAKDSRPSWARAWTPEDFARACRSMPEPSWRLLCFTVFEAEEDRAYLKGRLLVLASKLARRERWPEEVERRPCYKCGKASSARGYIDDLAELAMREWAEPDAYRTQQAQALYIGTSQQNWSKTYARKYQPLRECLEVWYGHALGHLWRELRGEVVKPAEDSCA